MIPLTFVKALMALNTTQAQQQADDLLSQLHEYNRSIHNTRFLIDVLALQALRHDARGEDAAAFETLIEALRLAEPSKIIRPFLDLGVTMVDLLNRLVRQEVSFKYIGILLKAYRQERAAVTQAHSGGQGRRCKLPPSQVRSRPCPNANVMSCCCLSNG